MGKRSSSFAPLTKLFQMPSGEGQRRRQGPAAQHRLLPHRAGRRPRPAGPVHVRHQPHHRRDIRPEGKL